MEFCVPTNWQKGRIGQLLSVNKTQEIKEVYGKLPAATIADKINSSGLVSIHREKAERHIKNLSKEGFSFNYLLDDICMNNLEFSRVGQKRIRNILEWLIKAGVASVTVANPYLLMWIKKNYPFLPVQVSELVNIDSLNRAQFWEGLSADKIIFPGPVANRNFKLLKLLRKSLTCKIKLIGNGACRLQCASYIHHALNNAHLSRRPRQFNGCAFDYYTMMCWVRRLENPINFIRCDWIRPEDIHLYEKMGVDEIQLVDNQAADDRFMQITGAYIGRSHKGNLIDLFPRFDDQNRARDKVFIDNQNLSNFLKEMPQECDLNLCVSCGYCLKVAQQVVRINQDYLQKTLALYKKTIDDLF